MGSSFNEFFPDLTDLFPFPERPLQPDQWKDGLLVRSPNWLGDAVMTFPALRQMRLALPGSAKLAVVCPGGLAPLFRSLDCVDLVIGLRDAHAFPRRDESDLIRSFHAGAALLFTNSFRDALIFKMCGIPKLRGTPARFRSFLMDQTFSFPPRKDRVLNRPHQAVKYLAMTRSFKAPEWDGVMPGIATDAEPGAAAGQILSKTGPLLLMAPGAAYGDAKRWAASDFRETAKWWTDRGGLTVSLGAAKELDAAREAVSGLPEDRAFCLAGETSLTDLIHLFRRADFCLANDSGLMHLAAAAGLPGIAVFGSTDPAATSPLSPMWSVLYRKQECAPCFRRICPDGTRKCLKAVTPELVKETLRVRCERLFA
ncbi:MAG: lipopolysaccharide heptosyltransferase II [Lentisphaeria bacterium]|nr:lipopolysaccharide heptosyltransferase II [Lentisphaeria bacterium]